jgi:GPH family glycoside/pentoside/hexuronide:cation symporter
MFDDSYGNYTTAFGGQLQGLLSIIGAVPTAVGMVIAWPLSNKIGKGKAILSGAVLAVLGGILGLLFPTNFPIVVTSFVIKALGSTPAMYLSLALLADILDHQEALHGARTDGFTMTIYGVIMAGMTGIATGIMNGVLSGLGYSTSNISSEAIRMAMPWIFIGGETIFYGIIFLTFLFMNVERFGALDHKAIVADQMAAAEAEGREYISHEEKIRMEEGEEAYQAELKKQADAREAEEKRIASLPPDQRKDEEQRINELLAEFNRLREANHRTAIK